jgi:hypothetical protein
MWIITIDGMFSINHLANHMDNDQVQVRSRRRDHLEAFCLRAGWPKGLIVEMQNRDYKYRTLCFRSTLQFYFNQVVDDLKYDNVKGFICPRRPEMTDLMHNLWSDGADMQWAEDQWPEDNPESDTDVIARQMIEDQGSDHTEFFDGEH